MSKPKLSVIIPCYNCDRTLREAVVSCYDQGLTADEFEIILVDDCSTDNTCSTMEALAREHTNITLAFHNTNQGGGATRNTAVATATAGVIFCLDSDDLLPPHTLRTMYDYLKEKQADGVGLNHSTKFNGTDVHNIERVDTFSYAGELIPLESLLQQGGILCPLYSVFMFTKEAFTRAGGYPTNHGFDTQGFAWRFLAAGLTAYTCPNSNYLHRLNFHQSYYLREHDAGRVNANWQAVLLEHEHLFTDDTRVFIRTYPVYDFTKNIFSDFSRCADIFVPTSDRRYGQSTLSHVPVTTTTIPRKSLYGLILRLKKRLYL